VRRLVQFCRDGLGRSFRVGIVENGSSDETPEIADRLAREDPDVRVVHVSEKGRGRALRRAFLDSDASVVGYMDADLSTHLAALPEALKRLDAGAAVVTGSRLLRGSHTTRRLRREVLSRAYNAIVRAAFASRLRDHQCGFKFLGQAALRRLVPLTRDDLWFFDTELLVLAQRAGLRVDEIPVEWIEDLGSTVHVLRTIADDFAGMWRLRQRLASELREI
jgi:glycosyltransferase involved in cell wall biosynthesis